MDRRRQKRDRQQETEEESSSQSLPTETDGGTPPANPDASQCFPYYIPSLTSAATYPLTNNDYLLLSLASRQQASNILPQPLYTNVMQGSLPFLQGNPLQPLVALSSGYVLNPYATLPPLPLYQQPQPMQLLIDTAQPFQQFIPGHFQGLVTNGLQVPYPHLPTRFSDASFPVEEASRDEDVQSGPAGTASNDIEASSESIKSESLVKPKRPLSAYNLFFQAERQQLIQNEVDQEDEKKRKRSGISFENLAKEISERWRHIDAGTLQHYNDLARADKERYLREMERFKKQQDSEMTKRRMDLESTVPEETMELYMKAQAKKPKKRKKADD